MKMNGMKKWLSLFVCIVLIAATALSISGCDKETPSQTTGATTSGQETEAPATTEGGETTLPAQAEGIGGLSDGQSLGQGTKKFSFAVVDLDGSTVTVTVNTDKDTVGEALLELGLIEGEQGAYGLYIKTVAGITYDYAADGVYWGFYIDGEYALTGVDATDIAEGATYTLKAEKA